VQLFRTLCVVAVLGALTYGAYITLTSSPPVEPPIDARNYDSPPRIELPAPGASAAASTSAPAATVAPAGAPAPKFLGNGAARLNPPTDNVAGTPMKPSAIASAPTIQPPAEYPKTNAPPGPFDAAGSAPLGTDPRATTAAPPSEAGPALPGLTAAPTTATPTAEALTNVTPVGGSTLGSSMPNVLQAAPAGKFQLPWDELNALVASKPAEALDRLSRSFDDPNLSSEENRRVMDVLDQLAGTVIYSRDHLLEPAHVVQPGERLDQIASQYAVSAELLAKINGVADPNNLASGTQLKVMRGPFGALVDKSRRQVSLFLGSLYAGSFACGFGQDQQAVEGYDQVAGKASDPATSIRWLDLGNNITIHTAVDAVSLDGDQARGCIRLDPAQAADVYDILSVGSEVIVRP
jgi:hypothetical protein